MTGSNILNIDYWENLIEIIFHEISILTTKLDIQFEFINIGGGLGVPYDNVQKELILLRLVKV